MFGKQLIYKELSKTNGKVMLLTLSNLQI